MSIETFKNGGQVVLSGGKYWHVVDGEWYELTEVQRYDASEDAWNVVFPPTVPSPPNPPVPPPPPPSPTITLNVVVNSPTAYVNRYNGGSGQITTNTITASVTNASQAVGTIRFVWQLTAYGGDGTTPFAVNVNAAATAFRKASMDAIGYGYGYFRITAIDDAGNTGWAGIKANFYSSQDEQQ